MAQTPFGRIVLFPLSGVLAFVSLYIIAALLYPGGSAADKTSAGFSWLHNYWCNLLNTRAINGEVNTGRPFALASLIDLCVTLAVFWILLPSILPTKRALRSTIRIAGAVSMAAAFFIFTDYHDRVIEVSGFFGLVALAGSYLVIYRIGWRRLFWLGIVNLALILLNNILYYGPGGMAGLPVVQKISFLSFLLWIALVDLRLFRYLRERRP